MRKHNFILARIACHSRLLQASMVCVEINGLYAFFFLLLSVLVVITYIKVSNTEGLNMVCVAVQEL